MLLQHSNINDLVGNEETALKVIIVYPKGHVVVRTPADKQSKNLIKNISLRCWKAVANGIFSHVAVREEMTEALQRAVSSEFKEYSLSDSIFKGTDPDQLAGFSTKLVLEEMRILCPLWNASMHVNASSHGAFGNRRYTNSAALCTPVAARVRNAQMSALAYRISAILFHADIGFDNIKMGESFDAKVYVTTLAFLEEVQEKQVPKFDLDDVVIETQVV